MLLRRTMGQVCVVLAIGLLFVGWWPFSFHPINHVGWVQDRAGLDFKPAGIVFDPQLLSVPAVERPSDQPVAFSVELWVKPGLDPGNDLFHILTIDDGRRLPNLVLCQWRSELLLRTREQGSQRGFREVGVGEILQTQKARFIAVTDGPSGTVFYADGLPVASFSRHAPSARSLSGRLILGNSVDGKHPWNGQVFGLAVFSRVLDATEVMGHHLAWTNCLAGGLVSEPGLTALYLFDQRSGLWADDHSPNRHRLFIPSRYEVLRKVVLSPPWEDFPLSRSGLGDVVINILGFVPFGFCVFCFRRMMTPGRPYWNVLLTLVIGAVVSLLIEFVQVWLPDRCSSSMDLICNIGGTFSGALLAWFVCFLKTETGFQSTVEKI